MSPLTLNHIYVVDATKKIAVEVEGHLPAGRRARSHLDGFQKLRVVVEELEDPGEHAGSRVLGSEQHADDVVGDLVVRERRPAVVAVAHEGVQEVVVVALVVAPPRTPLRQDAAQDRAQPPPRLHACMSKRRLVTL